MKRNIEKQYLSVIIVITVVLCSKSYCYEQKKYLFNSTEIGLKDNGEKIFTAISEDGESTGRTIFIGPGSTQINLYKLGYYGIKDALYHKIFIRFDRRTEIPFTIVFEYDKKNKNIYYKLSSWSDGVDIIVDRKMGYPVMVINGEVPVQKYKVEAIEGLPINLIKHVEYNNISHPIKKKDGSLYVEIKDTTHSNYKLVLNNGFKFDCRLIIKEGIHRLQFVNKPKWFVDCNRLEKYLIGYEPEKCTSKVYLFYYCYTDDDKTNFMIAQDYRNLKGIGRSVESNNYEYFRDILDNLITKLGVKFIWSPIENKKSIAIISEFGVGLQDDVRDSLKQTNYEVDVNFKPFKSLKR